MVEQPGFKKFQQNGILLQVNDNAKIDVRLELGEVNSEVRVESAGMVVETATRPERDGGRQRVVDLPLNGRNLADLTLLVPGVQPGDGANGDARPDPIPLPAVKALSVNGSRQNNLRYTLDGGDNSDNLFNTNLAFPFP